MEKLCEVWCYATKENYDKLIELGYLNTNNNTFHDCELLTINKSMDIGFWKEKKHPRNFGKDRIFKYHGSDGLVKLKEIHLVDDEFEYVVYKEENVVTPTEGYNFDIKVITKENLKHLEWIYERLIYRHKENPNVDYMLKMAEILNIKYRQKPFIKEHEGGYKITVARTHTKEEQLLESGWRQATKEEVMRELFNEDII